MDDRKWSEAVHIVGLLKDCGLQWRAELEAALACPANHNHPQLRPMTDDDSIRREHIRVGYCDNEGRPFDVDTDEEADETIRRDLRANNPNWRPIAMDTQQLYLYKPAHKRRGKRPSSCEPPCEENGPRCKLWREESRPFCKREQARET